MILQSIKNGLVTKKSEKSKKISQKRCDEVTYVKRCVLVRILQNDGFSNHQIRCLKPLIMNGYDHEGIRMMFNPGNDTEEIERVVGQLVQKSLIIG